MKFLQKYVRSNGALNCENPILTRVTIHVDMYIFWSPGNIGRYFWFDFAKKRKKVFLKKKEKGLSKYSIKGRDLFAIKYGRAQNPPNPTCLSSYYGSAHCRRCLQLRVYKSDWSGQTAALR